MLVCACAGCRHRRPQLVMLPLRRHRQQRCLCCCFNLSPVLHKAGRAAALCRVSVKHEGPRADRLLSNSRRGPELGVLSRQLHQGVQVLTKCWWESFYLQTSSCPCLSVCHTSVEQHVLQIATAMHGCGVWPWRLSSNRGVSSHCLLVQWLAQAAGWTSQRVMPWWWQTLLCAAHVPAMPCCGCRGPSPFPHIPVRR